MDAPRHTIIMYRLALLSFLFALAVFSAQSFAFGNLDSESTQRSAFHPNQ
jgi:hypothetical protein